MCTLNWIHTNAHLADKLLRLDPGCYTSSNQICLLCCAAACYAALIALIAASLLRCQMLYGIAVAAGASSKVLAAHCMRQMRSGLLRLKFGSAFHMAISVI
jgi:uncharacterized membrane protein (UPF0136 family)